MYMYLEISCQPNNQCQGTLHIGRIYCLLFRHGDNGVQRSINWWEGSDLNEETIKKNQNAK